MERIFVNAIFTNDTHTYKEMREWPNTPGHDRYIKAAQDYYDWQYQNTKNLKEETGEYIEGNPGDHKLLKDFTDVDHYRDMVHTQWWEEETLVEFIEDVVEEPHKALVLQRRFI